MIEFLAGSRRSALTTTHDSVWRFLNLDMIRSEIGNGPIAVFCRLKFASFVDLSEIEKIRSDRIDRIAKAAMIRLPNRGSVWRETTVATAESR